jgi:hypothetical protein
MASFLRKLGGAVAGAGRLASRNPLASAALSFIPGGGLVTGGLKLLGTAATAYGAYQGVSGLLGGGNNGTVAGPSPMMSASGGGGGVPMLPNMGKRSIFRDDPNVHAQLKQYAIAERFLKTYYRAPRGAVILRDEVGKPYALPKNVAKMYGMWKPAKKPPISVTAWTAFQHSKHVMKQLSSIHKEGLKFAAFASQGKRRAPLNTSYQVINEAGPGNVVALPAPRRRAA